MKKAFLVLSALFIVVFGAYLVVTWRGLSDRTLVDQTWNLGHEALVTEIEYRTDGLVNFERYALCSNGRKEYWTGAVGYEKSEYFSRFHIFLPPVILNGVVLHNQGSGLYLRVTGCDD